MKRTSIFAAVLALGLVLAACSTDSGSARAASSNGQDGSTAAAVEFQQAMRRLWEDHITWTRLFIVSAAADLPDKQATTERLLRNQQDIGDAIKPFYGEAAGNALTALLRPHILIAAEVVDAAIAGDNAGVQDALMRWYANSDEIADFLSAANPDNWPQNEMRAETVSYTHLTLPTIYSV